MFGSGLSRIDVLEERIKALEKRVGADTPRGFGRSFQIVPVYILEVLDDGYRIRVSPWDSEEIHDAFPLSPIPTNLEDGRRLQGIPTARESDKPGDTALCAVVDRRWYILGYFNLPDYETGQKISLARDYEAILPKEGGVIWKLSKLGQIILRKTNQLFVWLGSWAHIIFQGINVDDSAQESELEIQAANFRLRTWGGKEESVRHYEENTQPADWTTSYVDVKTRSYEPDTISDVDLDQKERNDGIDDVPTPADPIGTPRANLYEKGYVDKVIKRAGQIGDDTHVYEREVRQSKEQDTEKTVFTRLREGYREGVLREFETEDVLEYTKTDEKWGKFDDGRLVSREYYQYKDDKGNVQESLIESFGNNGTDLYKWELTNQNNQTITIEATEDGFKISLSDDNATLTLDAAHIEFGREPDTQLVRFTELQAVLQKLWDLIKTHDHNTGVGPSTPAQAGPTLGAQMATLDGPDSSSASIAGMIKAIASENTNVK